MAWREPFGSCALHVRPTDYGCLGRSVRSSTHRLTNAATPLPAGGSPLRSLSTAAACHPVASSGNCYEPGEYCAIAQDGETGLAGDGKTIICVNNNGWRWEPA